jgi:hypothetical protein
MDVATLGLFPPGENQFHFAYRAFLGFTHPSQRTPLAKQSFFHSFGGFRI